MINESKAFLGIPENFHGLFYIYPPKIKDVLEIPNFEKYLSILTTSQEDIEDQLFNMNDDVKIEEGAIPTPYQYLILLMNSSEVNEKLATEAFKFFTHKELTFIKEKSLLLIGNLEEILEDLEDINDLPVFEEKYYFEFQNSIRQMMGQEAIKPYDYNLHPKARKMKAKARYRDKIKARRNNKNGQGTSLKNNLASICCMGIGLNPLNIGEMSYAAMSIIIQKYQMKEKYDIDIRSLMAGASSKKVKPKYWMQENDEN